MDNENQDNAAQGQNAPEQGQSDSSAGQNTSGNNQGESILGAAPPAGAPDSYDFKSIIPEGVEYDEKAAGEFGAIAKELNLTQEQANKLATYGMGWMQGNVNAVQAAMTQRVAGWATEAKTALGGDYNDTVSKAVSVADVVERQVPGFKAMLNETGAGNRVELIKVMAHFSQFIRQDGGHGGSAMNGSAGSMYDHTDFTKY